MAFTNELRLICGLGAYVGDPSGIETPMRVLDLIATENTGFSVDVDGWAPKRPQLKGGGSWADSALVDGRALIAGVVNNVVETIVLTSSGATPQSRFALESDLAELGRLAREFWTTEAQIEPVYLRWKAAAACLEQYALIYNIDIAPEGDPFSPDNLQTITITVEREPYWRAVPPGANPKLYYFQSLDLRPGADFDYTNLSLWQGSDHFANGVVQNRHEWGDYDTTQVPLAINALDIPAENLPGDAPALVTLSMRPSHRNFLISRVTKRVDLVNDLGENFPGHVILNHNDAFFDVTSGSSAFVVSATDGVLRPDGSGVRNYTTMNVSAAGGHNTLVFSSIGTLPRDVNQMRGKYAVFMRAYQESGAAREFTFQFFARQRTAIFGVGDIAAAYSGPVIYSAAPGQRWALYYLGTFELPLDGRVIQDPDGSGLFVAAQSNGALYFVLDVVRQNAGALVMDLLDIILMPYDEALVEARVGFASANMDTTQDGMLLVLDNTGYMDRGRSEWLGKQYAYPLSTLAPRGTGVPIEARGQSLTLLPNTDNRLYFLTSFTNPTGGNASQLESKPQEEYEIRVNIVPRWAGVRDDCPPGVTSSLRGLTDDSLDLLLDESLIFITEDA